MKSYTRKDKEYAKKDSNEIKKEKKIKESICSQCKTKKPNEFFRSINACYLTICIKCEKNK